MEAVPQLHERSTPTCWWKVW